MTNQALRQTLAKAWIVLSVLALAACGSASATASSATPGFVGYHWQVVSIGRAEKVTPIPARLGVALQFSPGGQFVAFDGVSGHTGTYRATSDGFTTGVLAVTGNGYAGNDPAISLARLALDSFDGAAHATVRLSGDQLTVNIGSYTLTCRRFGPRAGTSASAGTG